MTIHLDNEGRPLCGAKALGAWVCDYRKDVTCPTCQLIWPRIVLTAATVKATA